MTPALEVWRLQKTFAGVRALSDFSMVVRRNEITGLIGPNGAGKTTLFNIIGGYVDADAGEVRLAGRPLKGLPPHERTRLGLARTFQDIRLVRGLTVLENVLLGFQEQAGEGVVGALWARRSRAQERRNGERARELLHFVGLDGKRGDPADTLSYGEQKLLTIACCLATGAKLLLLDEPVAGIQPETTQAILDVLLALKEEGTAILLIEHNTEAVRAVSDRIVVLSHGHKVAEGPPSTVMEDPAVVGAYLT